MVALALLRHDTLHWTDEQRDLDARTARLAVGALPRGIGLLSSAFGLLIARTTHAALTERLAGLAARLPASLDELHKDLAPTFLVGWLDPLCAWVPPARPAARADPRHLVITNPHALQFSGAQLADRDRVAEALAEVYRAGARAVPLQPAELPGEPEAMFQVAWDAMDLPQRALCCRQRADLLLGLGVVYVRQVGEGVGALPACRVGAPDLDLTAFAGRPAAGGARDGQRSR